MAIEIKAIRLVVLLLMTAVGLSATPAHAFERIQVVKTTEHHPLGPHLMYLEDREGKYSIEEIQKPASRQWQKNQTKVPAFGFTSSVYWFAIELENPNASTIKRLLALSYPLLDSVDVYLDRDGKVVERFHTGDLEPFAQRNVEHRHFLFPIHLLEGDRVTLYMRVKTTSAMQVPLDLWSERGFWQDDHGTSIAQGLYFGIMLAMLLYNLFIYSAVRDQSYIYYVLFVGCFVVFQLTLRGFAYHYIWPQQPWFNEKIVLISACASLALGGLFTMDLLGLKKENSVFYKLIALATLFAFVNVGASLVLNYTSAMIISSAIGLVMSSLGLAAGCTMWRRGYAPARLYTIAWIGLLLGTIAFLLSKLGALPHNGLTENGIQFGSAVEAVLLSFALVNRINMIREEKELAQSENVSILKKYRALYENAIEGIFQTTLEYKFVSTNRAMTHVFGLLSNEALLAGNSEGLKSCFANQAEADEFCQLLREKHKVIGHEFRAQKIDGREFWASMSARTIYAESGEPQHYEGSLVDISERRQAEEKVRYLAYYDNVTGLPNRALLQNHLKHAVERAKRNKELVAVLFVDLNRFKLVNDSLGHDAGDRLLQEVAERLNRCLRGGDWVGRPQSPSADPLLNGDTGDAVARLGGDEFVMVLTDIRNAEDTAIIARRINQALAQSFNLDEKEVYISASIGISTYPIDGDNPETLLKQADAAMYHIKKQGGEGYEFYTDSFTEDKPKRLTLETELRNAFSNDELQLYYQPKLDLRSGQICGVEALCRWEHSKLGMIAPTEFIALAEEIGLIVPLGAWVLRTACQDNKRWQDAGFSPITVSVNVSARQFNDLELSKTISHILDDSGLNQRYLELELTEGTVMNDTQTTGRILNELKEMGLRISIDDFGTGYSSLGYLKRFPVDVLKIDRCFIHNISQNSDNQAITGAIISMARQLEIKVLAEGVETESELDYLKARECDEIQGFLVSVPVSAEQFAS